MKCKYCGKILTRPYYGSGLFCNKKCQNTWIARNRSDRNSSQSISEFPDQFIKVMNNPSISWRDLNTGSYWTSVNILIRSNPIRIFSYSEYPIEYKMYLVRRLVDQKNLITSLASINRKYGGGRGVFYNFLMFCIEEFPTIKDSISDLCIIYDTWDLARMLGCNQKTIYRVVGPNGLDLLNRRDRSSKINLKMKPTIETILGVKTRTEKYIRPYWVDEFSPDLNLCIEIDGEWCHDKDHDDKKDQFMRSLGYSVVRIPAYSSEDKIRELLSPYIH